MTSDGGAIKRVKRQIKETPNPLFEQWLLEWKEEAEKNNSDMRYCYGKALKSLKKYPFKLFKGKECSILENFGNKLCYMLDKKLDEYKATHPEEAHEFEPPIIPDPNQAQLTGSGKKGTKKRKSKTAMDPGEDASKSDESASKKRKNDYVPAYRSAAYALILTLFEKTCETNEKEYMTKEELQNSAQDLCDASLKKPPEPGSHYTGWSSMATLVKKELVTKYSNPAKFKLTEKGVDLAIRLKLSVNDMQQNKSIDNIQSPQLPSTSKTNSPKLKGAGKTNKVNGTDLPSKSPKTKRAPRKKVAKPKNSPVKNYQELLLQNLQSKKYSSSLSDSERELSPAPSDKSSDTVDYDLNPEKNFKETNGTSQFKNIEKHSSETDEMVSSQATTSSEPDETLFLLPGTFDVMLLVDTQETEGKNQRSNDITIKGLKARGVNFEVKHLKVGDFTWICKDRVNGHELVLPYIIERKRMDDLGGSIKDGRFHEQKFRLKQCALENLIYLIEKYGNDSQRLGLPLPTLQQASWNTQIIDGFTVKVTKDHQDSIRYLSFMTTHLTNIFKDKTLMSCKKKDLQACNLSDDLVSLMTFKEFNKGSQKNKKLTVRDMLIKHLIQMNGMSVEKALVIVEQYPTPKRLIEALKDPSTEKKIANLTYGPLKHRVGPAIAKTVSQLYTMPVLK